MGSKEVREVKNFPSENSLNYGKQAKGIKSKGFSSENSLNYKGKDKLHKRESNFSEKLRRQVASEAKASENSVNYEEDKEEGKLDEARALSLEESVRFAASALDRLTGEESCPKPSAISLNYDEPVLKLLSQGLPQRLRAKRWPASKGAKVESKGNSEVVDCEAIGLKRSENSLNYELRAQFPSTTEAKASDGKER